jgi:hypothetical protein
MSSSHSSVGDQGASRLPENPENHEAAALHLFEQMQMETLLKSSIDTMLQAQIAQAPQIAPFEDILRNFFEKYMSWNALRESLLRMYLEAFTQRELEDINSFYSTPTGKKAIVLMPDLVQKGVALGQALVQENMPELQQLIQQRVQEMEADAPKGLTHE